MTDESFHAVLRLETDANVLGAIKAIRERGTRDVNLLALCDTAERQIMEGASQMTEHTDDGPDNLILRRLREIDRKQDVLLDRLDNLTTRVSALEGVIGLLVTQMATLNARVDNFDRRLERVERRLNLVEAPA
jgi:hypothetical protein